MLVECVRELAKYGPMKSEAERGLSEAQIREIDDEKANADLDPNGIRVGVGAQTRVLARTCTSCRLVIIRCWIEIPLTSNSSQLWFFLCSPPPSDPRTAPAREAVETLLRTAAEAEQKISKLAFAQKAVSSRGALQESFDHLRGAVMIAYPMGLPEVHTSVRFRRIVAIQSLANILTSAFVSHRNTLNTKFGSRIQRYFDLLQEKCENRANTLILFCSYYSLHLPSGAQWDVVRTVLEDTETFAGHALSKDLQEPKTCMLWWAGKPLQRDQPLSKFVGRNEKTKIVAKLTRKGAGAPAREAPVDAETQKNMMGV